MTNTRTCHLCGAAVPEHQFCQACTDAWPSRRDTEGMTAAERIAELRSLYGPLEVPFPLIHQRMEALVGRPIWTHELPYKEELIAEIRRGWPAPPEAPDA